MAQGYIHNCPHNLRGQLYISPNQIFGVTFVVPFRNFFGLVLVKSELADYFG